MRKWNVGLAVSKRQAVLRVTALVAVTAGALSFGMGSAASETPVKASVSATPTASATQAETPVFRTTEGEVKVAAKATPKIVQRVTPKVTAKSHNASAPSVLTDVQVEGMDVPPCDNGFTEADGLCVPNSDKRVIHEGDPGWDCRVMGNRECAVQFGTTWYVLDFDSDGEPAGIRYRDVKPGVANDWEITPR